MINRIAHLNPLSKNIIPDFEQTTKPKKYNNAAIELGAPNTWYKDIKDKPKKNIINKKLNNLVTYPTPV